MDKDKDFIEELKKEFQGQRVIVYPGPKRELKLVFTVVLGLSLIAGFSMLSIKRLYTGQTVFAYNPSNWYGFILIIIPLILVLYWLRKR